MPNSQPFGTASLLSPNLSIGGTDYGLLLRFFASAESDLPGAVVVPGAIQQVVDLGGGMFRVVCQRGISFFSYTVPGAQTEVVYACKTGGNVANAPEVLRFFSFVEPGAIRGDRSKDRAQTCDMLWIGPPGSERGYMIESAVAFAVAPAAVDYWPGENVATESYCLLDFHAGDVEGLDGKQALEIPVPDRSQNPGLRVEPSLRDAGYFDAGVWIVNDAGAFVPLERVIFRRPDGTPDADAYPRDASMVAGQYWLGETSLRLRLSSHNESIGSNVFASWFERGFQVFRGAWNRSVVIVGSGTGYDTEGDSDETVGVVTASRDDWEVSINLFKGGSQNFGAGAIEWHFPSVGRKAALVWLDGAIQGILARTEDGGPMEAVETVPFALSGDLVAVFARKVGGTISFHAIAPDGAFVDLGSVALPGVQKIVGGQLGVHCWEGATAKWSGFDGLDCQRVGTAGGDVIRSNFRKWSSVAYHKAFPLGAATAITKADSLAQFGAYSSEGSPRRRNHFEKIAANGVRFYSETAGDIVRFVQAAAPPVDGSGPGPCPRVSHAENFATPAEGGTGQPPMATDVVEENVANNFDALTIYAPEGFPFGPGASFRVRRDCVLDRRQPIKLYWALREEGEELEEIEEGDWAEISTGDYIARPAEGIFLLSAAWLTANVPPGATPCFRLTARFVRHHGNFDARCVTELARATEELENLHFAAVVSGTSVQVAGVLQQAYVVNTSFSCSHPTKCVGNSDGLMWGVNKDVWCFNPNAFEQRLGDYIRHGGLSLPAPLESDALGFCTVDSLNGQVYTGSDFSQVECCWDWMGPRGYNTKDFGSDARQIFVWPFDNGIGQGGAPGHLGLIANGFGAPIQRGSSSWTVLDTQFRFAGVGFDLPSELAHAPKGTQVVSAYLSCKFTGVRNRSWSVSESGRHPRNSDANGTFDPSKYRNRDVWINGVRVYHYVGPGDTPGAVAIVEELPEPPSVSSAPVTFVAVGRRLDSNPVVLTVNRAATYLDWEAYGYSPTDEDIAALNARTIRNAPSTGVGWKTYASIQTPTVVGDGVWTSIEVSGTLAAMISQAREDQCSQFMLFPSKGVSLLATAPDNLRDFLVSLDPVRTLDWGNLDDDFHWYNFGVQGQATEWDQLQVGNLLIQVRFPSGILSTFKLAPIRRGPMA